MNTYKLDMEAQDRKSKVTLSEAELLVVLEALRIAFETSPWRHRQEEFDTVRMNINERRQRNV